MARSTLGWAIRETTGKLSGYKKMPGTVLVWLIQDWPYQIANSPFGKRQGLCVVSGIVDLDRAISIKARGLFRSATSSRVYPRDAFEDDGLQIEDDEEK